MSDAKFIILFFLTTVIFLFTLFNISMKFNIESIYKLEKPIIIKKTPLYEIEEYNETLTNTLVSDFNYKMNVNSCYIEIDTVKCGNILFAKFNIFDFKLLNQQINFINDLDKKYIIFDEENYKSFEDFIKPIIGQDLDLLAKLYLELEKPFLSLELSYSTTIDSLNFLIILKVAIITLLYISIICISYFRIKI